MNSNSIFLFNRSLRVYDNIGLHNTIINSKNTICIFILNPIQISNINKYKSNNSINFMIEALIDLNEYLAHYNSKLWVVYGNEYSVLSIIFNNMKIDSVNCIMDYTYYSSKREKIIEKICKEYQIDFNIYEDILLHNINTIKNNSNKAYLKFTPFYNYAITLPVSKSIKMDLIRLKSNTNLKNIGDLNVISINNIKNFIMNKYGMVFSTDITIKGTRKEGLSKLKNAIKNKSNYEETKNLLKLKTTLLSAYLKFGLLSIREVYWNFVDSFGIDHSLVKQLYWREFYSIISYEYKKIIYFNKNIKEKYDKMIWNNNKNLKYWINGETGYPIVDAGMRELNATGYMHNRSRLITADFLIKILRINWREGEQYFATKLIDYDPMLNNGNWAWVSGSGTDSQPYYRIMNPWNQSKKYDADCVYIKKWVPELKNVDCKDIHNWEASYMKYPNIYFKPLVDYKTERNKTLKIMAKLS